jgi:hypothetical protein
VGNKAVKPTAKGSRVLRRPEAFLYLELPRATVTKPEEANKQEFCGHNSL